MSQRIVTENEIADEIRCTKKAIESGFYYGSTKSIAQAQDRLDALYLSHEALRAQVASLSTERDELRARIATLEAERVKIQRAIGNVCLAFHDWPEYTGSEYCIAERRNAINDLAEAAAPTAPS